MTWSNLPISQKLRINLSHSWTHCVPLSNSCMISVVIFWCDQTHVFSSLAILFNLIFVLMILLYFFWIFWCDSDSVSMYFLFWTSWIQMTQQIFCPLILFWENAKEYSDSYIYLNDPYPYCTSTFNQCSLAETLSSNAQLALAIL